MFRLLTCFIFVILGTIAHEVVGSDMNTFAAEVTVSFTEPIERSDVAAAESGVVVRVFVKEGAEVKAGDLLAELDAGALPQGVQLARLRAISTAKLRGAESILKIKLQQREALLPLLKSGHANSAEAEKAELEYAAALSDRELAEEEVHAAKLELERMETQLERRKIRSPISGIVTTIHRRLGEFIAPNDPRFATIVQLSQLRVKFYLDFQSREPRAEGDSVLVQLEGEPSPLASHVEYVAPVIDPDSGTTRVDIVLNNSDGKIRSGHRCTLLDRDDARLSDWAGGSGER